MALSPWSKMRKSSEEARVLGRNLWTTEFTVTTTERMHSSGPTDRSAIEVNKKLLKKQLRMNSIIADIVSAQELHEAYR